MATPELTAAIVKAYVLVARPYILQWFPERNSCIAAARTTAEVLARFGIHSWPLSVRMKAAVKELKMGYGAGLLPEERARMERQPNYKGRLSTRTKGWDGHLILGTEHHWLIDPTFDTAFAAFRKLGYDCGERNSIMAVQWHEEIDPLGFGMEATFDLEDGNKLEVTYLSSPNEEYRRMPAWETDHLQPVIRQICEAICRLGAAPVIRPESAAAQTQSPG